MAPGAAAQATPGSLLEKAVTFQPGFLPNRGQVRDAGGKPVDFVLYQANLGGQQVFVTNYGLSILLSRVRQVRHIPAQANPSKNSHIKPDSLPLINYDLERIDIVLKHASITSQNITTNRGHQPTVFNFHFDSYSRSNEGLRLQKELLVKNVYPHIDWKIYIQEEAGRDPHLKYDFIVHPGGDPAQIQLQYSQNAEIKITGGEITAKTKMGLIKEEKPYAYLAGDKSKVTVDWQAKKNTLSFKTADYNRNEMLVIDPSIFWLTYISSSNAVWVHQSITGSDVETDADGNIFVQLSAASNVPFPTINPGGGAFYQDEFSSPQGSMIICKFSPGGQMLWSTYFGNGVRGRLMTRDNTGNIYAIGTIWPGTPSDQNLSPSIPLLDAGGYYDPARKNHFITKFSNAGSLLWSSNYCGFSSYPTDMSFDSNGNIYVTGWSENHDFPTVDPGGGAYTVTNPQAGWAQVLFVSQFNSDTKLLWSTRIEGNDYDPDARISIDRSGNIYIAGDARSANYPLADAGGYYNPTAWGAVLTRFNAARQITWSTYLPEPFSIADVTTDKNDNVYVLSTRNIYKFDANTQLVFVKAVATTRIHFWQKIVYDAYNDQLQLLGVMNDAYWGFPTLNTACNGSFFNDGVSPHTFLNATGPIFATMNTAGDFSYLTLVDWVYEYYDYSEMAVDPKGDIIYLFGNQQNGSVLSNPQLTNPGNGAYFDPNCCSGSNGNLSALILKLTTSELSFELQITPPSGCSCDGTATAIPQCGKPGFTYLWSNGATTSSVPDLCPGKNQWVRVTDANHLSKTTYFDMPYPPGSISSVSKAIVNENCDRANGSVIVNAVVGGTPPFTYSLDGINYTSSSQFNGLAAGTHIVRIKDGNGCVFSDTSIVLRIQGPSAVMYTTEDTRCSADDGQLKITQVTGGVAPYRYALNTSSVNTTGIFTGLAEGNYQLTTSDAAGCSITQSVSIGKHSAPTSADLIVTNDHCNLAIGKVDAGTITGGQPPYFFSIDNTVFTAAPPRNLVAGNYDLFIKDAYGCVLKTPGFIIRNEEGPKSMLLQVEHAYCGKSTGSIEISTIQGGAAPYTYSVDGGPYLSANKIENIQPGTHQLLIRDAYGCSLAQNFQVQFKEIAKFDISPKDTTICYGEMISVKLTGDINRLHDIDWNIPAGGSTASIRINDEQAILVNAKDDNNCRVSNTAIVKVKACNPPEKCVAIPTAFTPNNDGKNDEIGPIINGCRIKSIKFRIYNRWGEIVFETQRTGATWNGTAGGIAQDAGVFTFFCEYATTDDVILQQRGTITLIR